MSELLGKRVEVVSGPNKGFRFTAHHFERGLYWTLDNYDEPVGFLPEELREVRLSFLRRLLRKF